MFNNTIAAISTPIGSGGISIVRVSGDNAIDIVSKIFKPKNNKNLNDVKSHTIHYGEIVDNNKTIDEVLVSVMKAPNTFTRENIVEINCHGGIVPTQKILDLLLKSGADIAEPGEFTKRAFLNGRLDLSQAEAVIDIINSKTDISRQSAVNQLEGSLSQKISNIKNEVLDLLSNIEANIDYPEYDTPDITISMLESSINDLKSKIDNLLKTADNGKIFREGINVAIIGKPNVGKSSLLNRLINEQKAIVTDIAGTTRDIVEEYININGIPIKLIDTAGIRTTSDVVEKIGIDKSKQSLGNADLILFLLDNSSELTQEDYDILDLTKNKQTLIIINKIDLDMRFNHNDIEKHVNKENILTVSVEKNIGIDNLEKKITDLFIHGNIDPNNDVMVTNTRHKNSLIKAYESLLAALKTIENGLAQDFISIDLQNAYKYLGEITGESVSEDIITDIFSKFCLGK